MLRQFIRFIVIAFVVGIAIYITLTNSETATIRLGSSDAITSRAGVIYLGVFASGCLFSIIIALFFGAKGFFRERKLRTEARKHRDLLASFIAGCDLMAIQEWRSAQDYWEDVLSNDGDNPVARVALSRCLEMLGDSDEACRVIDSAREQGSQSIAILARASELHRKMGNLVVARDNLSLIAKTQPSQFVLENLRDLHTALGDYSEALAVQDTLDRLGFKGVSNDTPRASILFKKLHASASEAERTSALSDLLKRYPSYVPALHLAASQASLNGNIELSAELLMRVAKTTKLAQDWKAVIDLWLNDSKLPQERKANGAIAVARTAIKSQEGLQRLEAELQLIGVLLTTNHLDEAERLLNQFHTLASKHAETLPQTLQERFLLYKGLFLSQAGQARDTGPLWQELVTGKELLHPLIKGDILGVSSGSQSPRPELSTP